MKKAWSTLTVLLVMAITITSVVAWGEDDGFIDLTQIADLTKKWEKISNFSYPDEAAPLFKSVRFQNPNNEKERASIFFVYANPNIPSFHIHSFHRVFYKKKEKKGRFFLKSYYQTNFPEIFVKFFFYESTKGQSCGKCHDVPTVPDPPAEKETEPKKPVDTVLNLPSGQLLSLACFNSHLK